jgi:hypothetical protein
MATDGESEAWYVRSRGRVRGPLSWAQVQSLRDLGQLARFDEVSQDRQTWTAAGRMPRLFPQQGEAAHPRAPSSSKKAARSAEAAEFIVLSDDDDADAIPTTAGTLIEDDTEWYYAHDRTQYGPVRLARLQRMADAGEIGPATLVWREGFEQWVPASHVDELRLPIRFDAVAAAQDDANPAPSAGVTLPPRQSHDASDPANPPYRTSILAINSLVMGCLWLFGLGSLVAIVLGVTAMRQIARSQGTLTGRRLATAGIMVGIAGLGLALVLLLIPGLFASWSF